MKAYYVLHHDDPPCNCRLNEKGECQIFKGVHPDMQSTQLWPYCPNCKIPLNELTCPACHQTFEKP